MQPFDAATGKAPSRPSLPSSPLSRPPLIEDAGRLRDGAGLRLLVPVDPSLPLLIAASHSQPPWAQGHFSIQSNPAIDFP